jgi:hypothetical protein
MPVSQSALDAEENAIAQGSRISSFLADPVVSAKLQELEQTYYDDWKAAATVEDRERAHAKASVLDDLRRSLQGVVQSAEQASTERARREKEDAPRPPRPGRRI